MLFLGYNLILPTVDQILAPIIEIIKTGCQLVHFFDLFVKLVTIRDILEQAIDFAHQKYVIGTIRPGATLINTDKVAFLLFMFALTHGKDFIASH